MKISMIAMNTMLKVINDKFAHISFYENGNTLSDEPLKFGVNWGCSGTVDPDEANDFANELKKAASVATELNRLELERVYGESDVLGDNEWTRKFMEHVNRKDISASFVVAEIESTIIVCADRLF